jgi:hypothetical protein
MLRNLVNLDLNSGWAVNAWRIRVVGLWVDTVGFTPTNFWIDAFSVSELLHLSGLKPPVAGWYFPRRPRP